MRRFAEAAAEWSDPGDETGDEPTLPPEARALIWHLHAPRRKPDRMRRQSAA